MFINMLVRGAGFGGISHVRTSAEEFTNSILYHVGTWACVVWIVCMVLVGVGEIILIMRKTTKN